MALDAVERRLFQRFAQLLEYPQSGLGEAARECEALLALLAPSPMARAGTDQNAATLLRAFRTFSETTPLARLEEVYSGTFDLDPACHPYVGYHVLGESYKRSVFLVELKARYRAQGFDVPENELPDHLAVMLRFLAANDETSLTDELIREALLPALDRMTGRGKSAGYDEEGASGPPERQGPDHPYRGVLDALRLVLRGLLTNRTTVSDQRTAVV